MLSLFSLSTVHLSWLFAFFVLSVCLSSISYARSKVSMHYVLHWSDMVTMLSVGDRKPSKEVAVRYYLRYKRTKGKMSPTYVRSRSYIRSGLISFSLFQLCWRPDLHLFFLRLTRSGFGHFRGFSLAYAISVVVHWEDMVRCGNQYERQKGVVFYFVLR